MKKLLSLLSVLLFTFNMNVSAQDAKAKAILDKLSTKVKSFTSIKANFTFSMLDAKGKSNGASSGSFLMKGNKYNAKMAKQQIICDGETIWTYLISNKEVQISTFDPNAQGISPAKLFAGSYTKDYKSVYKEQKIIDGKKVDIIEMTPYSTKGFKKVVLNIDAVTSMINGGMMYDKSGNTYKYTISSVVPNAKVTDANFIFDTKKYPDVDVVDLR